MENREEKYIIINENDYDIQDKEIEIYSENKDKENAPCIISISPSSKFDMCFKILIIGNCSVGKTCLTNRATQEEFKKNYQPTIGLEYFTIFIKLNYKIIKLLIWDTCGQEKYCSLISNYYRNASLAIIVYSVDNLESFKDIDFWIKELKLNSSPDIKLMLIGNKKDLIEERQVQYDEGKKIANDYGFYYFSETSAKTGENVKEIFIKATRIVYEDYLRYDENSSIGKSQTSSLKINYKKKKKRKKSCC